MMARTHGSSIDSVPLQVVQDDRLSQDPPPAPPTWNVEVFVEALEVKVSCSKSVNDLSAGGGFHSSPDEELASSGEDNIRPYLTAPNHLSLSECLALLCPDKQFIYIV